MQILTLVGHFKTLALVSAVTNGTLGTTSSMALLTGASFAKATAAATAATADRLHVVASYMEASNG